MRYPQDDFKTKWYIAQGFGEQTSYGYHDGVDLNLKTGGDTDLGQPIYAIADGIVTSIHNHISTNTFGNHIHIEHTGAWGKVFCHYAHCQSIVVKVGDMVKEGQVVAYVGKSGTVYAHNHWSIKREPTGIDGIAKTQDDLKKWTDPILFVEQWMSPQNTMEDKILADEFRKLTQHNGSWLNADLILKDISVKDEAIGTRDQEITTLLNQLGGKDSAITKAQRERDEALAEVQNKDDQVGRLREELLLSNNTKDSALREVKLLQQKLDETGKVVGGLNQDIARLQSEIRELKKSSTEPLTLGDVLVLLFKKTFQLKLK